VQRLPCVWLAVFGGSFHGGGDYEEVFTISAHLKPCGVLSVVFVSVFFFFLFDRACPELVSCNGYVIIFFLNE
jgi:hypothetical protein